MFSLLQKPEGLLRSCHAMAKPRPQSSILTRNQFAIQYLWNLKQQTKESTINKQNVAEPPRHCYRQLFISATWPSVFVNACICTIGFKYLEATRPIYAVKRGCLVYTHQLHVFNLQATKGPWNTQKRSYMCDKRYQWIGHCIIFGANEEISKYSGRCKVCSSREVGQFRIYVFLTR